MVQRTTQLTDPYETDLAIQTGTENRARYAFRVSVATVLVMLVFTLYNVYTSSLAPSWHQYAHIGFTTIVGVVAAVSAWLARRGRSNLGVGLLIGVTLLMLLIAPLTISGLGVVFGLAAVLLGSGLAGLTLPPKQARLAIIVSVFVGILSLLLDLFVPLERPTAVSTTVIVGLILGLFLIYGVFIARQFGNYSLRTKLIVAFLVVSVLSVGAVVLLNNRTTTAALEEQVGSNLHSLADSQAVVIGDLLIRQVDLLQTIASNRLLKARLEVVNAAYEGDLTAIQARLQELDHRWISASDSDLLIQNHVNDMTAKEFKQFQTDFPDHVEVFLTDQYGGLMSATDRTSDYYQADEAWWQAAFNNGQGDIYIGLPEYDESSATFAVNMAIPVYAYDSGEVIGVLRSTYQVGALIDLLAAAQLGRTGEAVLYLPGNQTISVDNTGLVPADPDTLTQLQASNSAVYARFAYEGIPSLVSQAPLRAITGEPIIDQLGWTVTVHQADDEALAPVQAQTQASLLLALVIVALAGATAVGMAQLLAGPITRLTGVARRVAEGDLTARAKVESRDEVGELAETFNTMTGQLRDTIGTLEVRVAGRTRQLETVVEVSQRLAGILELSDLMRQVVTLTKETFDYYHAHIYLLEGETLLMTEGYGEAGAEMKRQGHNIPLAAPRSLVARAAREGRVITVENVREDPDWLPNPLLPDTHSEMAVPVMLGAEVVGVLDVQSDRGGGLTQEDENTMRVLANQVAIAVRNARLFAQTQDALYEAQRLQRLYTGEAWEQFRAARRTTDYEFRQSSLPPLQEVTTPEAMLALEQERTVDFRFPIGDFGLESTDGESTKDTKSKIPPGARERNPNPAGQMSKMGAALATPLKLRDEVIGVLGIHDENADRRWSEEELALIEAVSEQMSLAIENARLFETTQRDAWRNQMVSETTAHVWASSEIEEVMKAAVAELGDKLKASEVVIRLGTESKLEEEQL